MGKGLEQFRRICMLSGCDYLDSIQGMGLKTASKLVTTSNTFKTVKCYKYKYQLITEVKAKFKNIPACYWDLFFKFELAFIYQLVYDPILNILLPLNPVPSPLNIDNMNHCGVVLEKKIIDKIITGDIDPNTHEPIVQQVHIVFIKLQEIEGQTSIKRFLCICKAYILANIPIVSSPVKLVKVADVKELKKEIMKKLEVKSHYFS